MVGRIGSDDVLSMLVLIVLAAPYCSTLAGTESALPSPSIASFDDGKVKILSWAQYQF